MTRIAITEDEQYPVYFIAPVDPGILAEIPDAGVEVDEAFIADYERAKSAWDAIQGRLGDMVSARDSAS